MNNAKIVNKKDFKKTVKGKKNISNAKPYLFNPLKLKWPQIESSKQEIILKNLKKCFMEKNLKSSLLIKPSKEEKTKVYRPMNQICLSNEDLNIRSQLITGIKEVTRNAEQNKLKFILIDRSSPWQLHRHLIQIVTTYHCHAAAIDNLSDLMASFLGLSRLSALAFRKINESDSKYFVTYLEEFEALVPLIEIPFLSNNKEDNKLEKLNDTMARTPFHQIFPSTSSILNNESCISENSDQTDKLINITIDESEINGNLIPDNICFKKRKIENQDYYLDNSNDGMSFIKFDDNIENDSLFSKASVFKPKKVNEESIVKIIRMDINKSIYIRSDVRKKSPKLKN